MGCFLLSFVNKGSTLKYKHFNLYSIHEKRAFVKEKEGIFQKRPQEKGHLEGLFRRGKIPPAFLDRDGGAFYNLRGQNVLWI